MLILVVTLVGTLLTAGTVFAGSRLDAVSDKVKELHELEKAKKDGGQSNCSVSPPVKELHELEKAKKEMSESLEGVPSLREGIL